MTKKVVKNTSESFRRILSKTQGTFIKRKALVDLAQLEYSMSREHANKSSGQEMTRFNLLILLNLNFICSTKRNLFAPSLVH